MKERWIAWGMVVWNGFSEGWPSNCDHDIEREPALRQQGEICSRKKRAYIERKGRVCYIEELKKTSYNVAGM